MALDYDQLVNCCWNETGGNVALDHDQSIVIVTKRKKKRQLDNDQSIVVITKREKNVALDHDQSIVIVTQRDKMWHLIMIDRLSL